MSLFHQTKCYVCNTDLSKIIGYESIQKKHDRGWELKNIAVLWDGKTVKVCPNCSQAISDGAKIYKQNNPNFKPPMPKEGKKIFFESPAEEKAYPIIEKFAKQYNFDFSYQEEVGWQSGGYANREEYYRTHGYKYESWMDDYYGNWEASSWGSEVYRIDFVLMKKNKRFAIEIDGAQWHTGEVQKKRDQERDYYLKNEGYIVIRIQAKHVLYNSRIFENKLKELEEHFDYF